MHETKGEDGPGGILGSQSLFEGKESLFGQAEGLGLHATTLLDGAMICLSVIHK